MEASVEQQAERSQLVIVRERTQNGLRLYSLQTPHPVMGFPQKATDTHQRLFQGDRSSVAL